MIRALSRLWAFLRSFGDGLNRRPPWGVIRGVNPLLGHAGETNIYWVSRHDLAECGLWVDLPMGRHRVAEAGDFLLIRRGVLPGTGVVVEFIPYEYPAGNGQTATCYLVASPDTEHGDHLKLDNCQPHEKASLLSEMNTFVRRTYAEILQDRHGADMRLTADGNIAAALSATPYEEGSLWIETGKRDPITGEPIKRPATPQDTVQPGMRFHTYVTGRFVPIMHEDAQVILSAKKGT